MHDRIFLYLRPLSMINVLECATHIGQGRPSESYQFVLNSLMAVCRFALAMLS